MRLVLLPSKQNQNTIEIGPCCSFLFQEFLFKCSRESENSLCIECSYWRLLSVSIIFVFKMWEMSMKCIFESQKQGKVS